MEGYDAVAADAVRCRPSSNADPHGPAPAFGVAMIACLIYSSVDGAAHRRSP